MDGTVDDGGAFGQTSVFLSGHEIAIRDGVRLADEDSRPAISARGHVVRQSLDDETGEAGHGAGLFPATAIT